MMLGSLRRNCFRKLKLCSYFSSENELPFLHYESNEEIGKTYYKTVEIIGINLPDSHNSLNNSALIKLTNAIAEFDSSDHYSVAVLHGFGGNFCTGLQSSVNIKNAENLINTMSRLKKPTVACLTGFTTFFGFQLALMCDFRIMDSNAYLGLGKGKEKDSLFPVAFERFVSITNLASVLDIILTGASLNHSECATLGLTNRCVDCGTALGKSVSFATSIAKYPLQNIIKEKKMVYEAFSKNRYQTG